MKNFIIAIMILFPASIAPESCADVVLNLSQKYDIPPCLIKAIIHRESRGRTQAKRFEKKVRDWSYGAMQIRWKTATQELGFRGTREQMLNLEVNVELGIRYLVKKLRRYGTVERAVAAYNVGSVGKVIKNKEYVNDVMRLYATCEVH